MPKKMQGAVESSLLKETLNFKKSCWRGMSYYLIINSILILIQNFPKDLGITHEASKTIKDIEIEENLILMVSYLKYFK